MNSTLTYLYRRSLLLFPVTCILLLFLLYLSHPAYADTGGPVFNGIYPANNQTVNQTKIIIAVSAHDSDLLNISSLSMKVDGATVSPIAQYAPIDESTDDFTTLDIYYPVTLTQGSHTVYITVKDRAGNTGNTTWSFKVSHPPQILSLNPSNGATAVSRTPVISATVTSGDNINRSSIAMTLNGLPVPAAFDPVTGVISHIPAAPLDNESFYNVALSLKDSAGNPINVTWQFYVSTFQEMAYSVDDTTCQKCHARSKHAMTNCTKCHGINLKADNPSYPIDDCYGCHFGTTGYPAKYHTNGLPIANPPNHPVQETDSCVTCHNESWPSTNIPAIHNVFDTAVSHNTTTTGCADCHSSSLTREHQRRLDDQGNPLTCFTCHNSPDSNVKNAIATKNSACEACHSPSAHPAHDNGLDINCQPCHSSTILQEKQFHAKNGCNVCHGSTDPLVQYNINIRNSSCFACHDTGHNVSFIQKTPDDIPLYSGFEWSVPQKAALWAGETWLPAGFNSVGAKYLVSNHRKDITGTQLFDWYTEELPGWGWQKSSGPDRGSDNFSLAYEKGTRRINITVYSGADRSPSAPYAGARVEILFK